MSVLVMVADSNLGWLMEVIEEVNDVHDSDNKQLTTSVLSPHMSDPNKLLLLGILGS